MRDAIDIFSPRSTSSVLAEFLREGHFGRHLRRMRALYEKRRDALVRGLARARRRCSRCTTPTPACTSRRFCRTASTTAIVREAARRGIDAIALSTCYVGPQPRSGLILGFGGASERRIVAACKTLGEVLRQAR